MAGRSFITGLFFLTVVASVVPVGAQSSDDSPSLVDRLNSFRKGWSIRSKESPDSRVNLNRRNLRSADSRNAVSPREPHTGRQISEFPRVNSRDLLPRDMSSAVRRRTNMSQNQPKADSNTPDTRTASRPSTMRSMSLGDAYLNESQDDESEEGVDRSGPVAGFGDLGSSTEEKQNSAGIESETVTASRPSPMVRRSPESGQRYDFDPSELSRDLVDSSGKSAADRAEPELAEPELQVATKSKEKTEPRLAQAIPLAESQEQPIPLPLTSVGEAVDELSTGAATKELQSLPTGPIAETPLGSTEEELAADPIDQERVKIAGEKAFANDSQATPMAQEDSFSAGNSSLNDSANGSFHQSQGYSRQRSFLVGENILASNSMPMISSHVSGPQHVLIGRESIFRVHLSNRSEVAAQEVVAQIQIPAWADVIDTTATTGIIQRAQNAREPNTYRWQLHRLSVKGHETLNLKLIPRSSRPLELGVDCTFAQSGSRAVVEVQEPKLRMNVSGPDEVLYNKAQLYRLTLTNPGTGLAEGVVISLLPPGGGEQAVSTHEIGELAPGTSKSVEVELTAREPGKLFVQASAEALGGLTAEAKKDIFCRKPELEIDWRGPEQKYSGTVSTYYLRVRNPGTAAADGVVVSIRIPKGTEFITASDGQMFDPDQNEVRWRVGSLRPGDDYYMELKCMMNLAGVNSFDIEATTDEKELSDSEIAQTNVIALADLKLEVSDPKGPIPVGEEAIYEIRVRNRGSNTAKEINIVALFSDGINAQTVEGAQYTVADGRVTFRTIEKLAADREVVLRIRAQATRPGTHVFRAEVRCRDLEIKLAAEETTRFFEDDIYGGSDTDVEQAAGRPNPFGDPGGSRY